MSAGIAHGDSAAARARGVHRTLKAIPYYIYRLARGSLALPSPCSAAGVLCSEQRRERTFVLVAICHNIGRSAVRVWWAFSPLSGIQCYLFVHYNLTSVCAGRKAGGRRETSFKYMTFTGSALNYIKRISNRSLGTTQCRSENRLNEMQIELN